MHQLRNAAMCGAILALVSCASSPDPKLYKLPDLYSQTLTASDAELISLSELEMPAYARNLQITTAISATELEEDDQHRWASPPTEMFTSALAQHIEHAVEGVVLVRPLPAGIRSEFVVEVEFDALYRTRSGGAHTRGQFILIGPGKSNHTQRFKFDVMSNSSSYEDYALALNGALRLLAGEISIGLERLSHSIEVDRG